MKPLLAALFSLLPAAALELTIPGVEEPILVSLPKNHDPEKSWPAVFCYHGQGGRPETATTRRHTGDRDWIVVGMAYVQRGAYQVNAESLAKELEVLRRVRDQLAASHGLDPARLYLAGYSKGGWVVDSLLQAERSLAGGAILMAGHLVELPANPAPYAAGTPVFIGVGRLDANHFLALKALQFHRRLGATVTFEAWPGLAHAFPADGSIALTEWFALRNGATPGPESLESEHQRIRELPAAARWHALTAFRDRPFPSAPDSPWPARLKDELATLEQDPAAAREAEIFNTHRQLLAREISARTLPDFQRIDAGYIKLFGLATDSPQNEALTFDHRRILDVLEKVAESRIQVPPPTGVTPNLPKREPLIPGNPRVR